MFPLQKLIRTPIHLLVNTLFLHNIFRSNKRQLLSKHLYSANFISMSSVCLYCMLLWKGLSEHLIEESGNVFCSIGDINCVVRKSSPSTEANTVKSWIGGSFLILSFWRIHCVIWKEILEILNIHVHQHLFCYYYSGVLLIWFDIIIQEYNIFKLHSPLTLWSSQLYQLSSSTSHCYEFPSQICFIWFILVTHLV